MHPEILVTGARGFIGQVLVRMLLKRGRSVRILTRTPQSAGYDSNLPGIDVWQGDLAVPVTLIGITEGIHTVYHLAGEIRDQEAFNQVNHQGTEYLLKDCLHQDVRRFLYLSSVGVIGAGTSAACVDETTLERPRNAYEVSKYAGEQVALTNHGKNGMRVVILRPSVVYGEGRNPQSDSFLFWVRLIKKGRYFQIGKDFISSYAYVGDVAAACIFVQNDIFDGGIFIINEPVSLTDFVAEIAKVLEVKEPSILPSLIGSVAERFLQKTGRFATLYNRTRYRMNRLNNYGFGLPYGYRVGLRRTLDWYRQKGLLGK